jgi:hypothetical protein
MDSKRALKCLGMRQWAKWEKKVAAIHLYQPTCFQDEMSDFPGVASYTWKNNLPWLGFL